MLHVHGPSFRQLFLFFGLVFGFENGEEIVFFKLEEIHNDGPEVVGRVLFGGDMLQVSGFRKSQSFSFAIPSGQISIIPKPELRDFGGIPLLNHHLR